MAEENEYERQRAETIARNRRKMEELGIGETKRAMDATATAERGAAAKTPRVTKPRERKPKSTGPARRSVRNEGRPTPNYTGMDHIGEARLFRASRTPRRRGDGPSRLPGGHYAMPADPREWHESRGQASDEAAEAALDAALSFISEALEAAPDRKDDFHWKVLSHSQCRGGYWSTAVESLRIRMKIVQRNLTFTLGEVSSEATMPYTACVDGAWPVVWLPHGGEARSGGKGRKKTPSEKVGATSAGFSGGWKGFARDLMLYPRDVCVFEVEEASTEGNLPDALKIHIFRAFDYEEDGDAIKAAAAEAWDQMEAELGLERAERAAGEAEGDEVGEKEEEEEEGDEEEEEDGDGRTPSYVTPTERLDLSKEGEAAGEDDQEAESPERRAGGRRRCATLTAAVAAGVTAGSGSEEEEEEEAPAPKRRKTQAAQKKQNKGGKAAKKAAAKRKASKKKAATPESDSEPEEENEEEEERSAGESEEDEEHYDVERIEGVKTDETTGQRLYWIKWTGYGSDQNSWEPAEHLDDEPHTYPLGEGVVL